MRNNKKFHRGGVLLLVLILALNMLLPMEALAAGAPSKFTYSISMWLSDGYGAQLGTNTDPSTGKCKWEDIGEVLIGNGTYSVQSDADGHMSLEGDASSSYVGKYLSSDGQSAVLATDIIPEEGSTIFLLTSLPLDFTAPESLSMRVTQGHSDLAIDPCVITNTGSEDLKLSQVEITAASGWTVVNASTDFTTAESKNKIAFTAGGHDFANGAYTPNEKIAAGGDTTLQLAGKISEKADLTNATQVASMVLTVEKEAALISFTIDGTSYQAEEGMTWGEWIDSSYNNGLFYADATKNVPRKVDNDYYIAIIDQTMALYDIIEAGTDYDTTTRFLVPPPM